MIFSQAVALGNVLSHGCLPMMLASVVFWWSSSPPKSSSLPLSASSSLASSGLGEAGRGGGGDLANTVATKKASGRQGLAHHHHHPYPHHRHHHHSNHTMWPLYLLTHSIQRNDGCGREANERCTNYDRQEVRDVIIMARGELELWQFLKKKAMKRYANLERFSES